MPYKITGTLNENARIFILNSSGAIESQNSYNMGDYEISDLVSGTKSVVARTSIGAITGYGNISPYKGVGNRGLFAGGRSSSNVDTNSIDYVMISITGNSSDFGDLTIIRGGSGGTSNGYNDRGIFASSADVNTINLIDYINIATPSNATYFGNMTYQRSSVGVTSNNTNDRCVITGGAYQGSTRVNTIEYLTISTTGNTTDFGDLTQSKSSIKSTSNGTNNRGITGGGYIDATGFINIIEYLTISTPGNGADFGDLSENKAAVGQTSNLTNNKAIFGGGHKVLDTTWVNTIEYITISTTGNAQDFGDLSMNIRTEAISNGTNNRGLFLSFATTTANVWNNIEYVTISNNSNSTDFGDLIRLVFAIGTASNS